jgi:hypothetical protein
MSGVCVGALTPASYRLIPNTELHATRGLCMSALTIDIIRLVSAAAIRTSDVAS